MGTDVARHQFDRLRRVGTPAEEPYDAQCFAGLANLGYDGPVFIVGLAPSVRCDDCGRREHGYAPVMDLTVSTAPTWLLLCYRCFRADGAMTPNQIGPTR